jgi:hypothetical protein
MRQALELISEVFGLLKSSVQVVGLNIRQQPEIVLGAFYKLRSRSRRSVRPRIELEPSPRYPGKDASTVLKYPKEERVDFAIHVLSRVAWQICTGWVQSVYEALAGEGLDEVSDAELTRILTDTVFSRCLSADLNASDREVFGSLLAQMGPDRIALKIDLGALRCLEPLEGRYVAPSVTLLSRSSASASGGPDDFRVEAIWINGLLMTRELGGAWELSKYFVLQGVASTMVLHKHPRTHFPMDAINAISKSELPAGHPLLELILPHTWLTLPLNWRVQWSPHSVLSNQQELIYSPFATTGESNFRFKALGITGIEGDESCRKYRYPLRPETDVATPLSGFYDTYFEAILRLSTEVCERIGADDPWVKRWAAAISRHVEGFPGEDEIFSGDTLARAVAFFIFDVSVMHATEHYSYSRLGVRQVPFCLRVPPPVSRHMPPVDRSKLVKPIDIFRHSMAKKMFFTPSNVSRLGEVHYEFADPGLKRAALRFRHELEQLDGATPRRYIPLAMISASIQY